MNKQQRQQLIKEILQQREVKSQMELVKILAAKGLSVTQATVSRDLTEIGAHKKKTSHGLTYLYEPGEKPKPNKLAQIFNQFVFSVQKSANLILLKTAPAAAQTVAACLDKEKLSGVLGTVAGDDTVLVVLAENEKASRKLQAYFESLI